MAHLQATEHVGEHFGDHGGAQATSVLYCAVASIKDWLRVLILGLKKKLTMLTELVGNHLVARHPDRHLAFLQRLQTASYRRLQQ